jgi:hypothetical protein
MIAWLKTVVAGLRQIFPHTTTADNEGKLNAGAAGGLGCSGACIIGLASCVTRPDNCKNNHIALEKFQN